MKLLLAAILPFLAAGPAVRFESEGVRVGDVLVQGAILEVRGAEAASLLASGSAVEALSRRVEVELAEGRTLTLDPGVRVARRGGAYVFSAHEGRSIRFSVAGVTHVVAGSAEVSTGADGWVVAGRALPGARLAAGLQGEQDDTDTHLDKMRQSATRMRDVNTVQKPNGRTVRVFFMGAPLTGAQAADSISVRQIQQLSQAGAP